MEPIPDDVEEVEVVAAPAAARTPRAVEEVPAEVVERERGEDLAEVLATVPGVTRVRGAGATSNLMLRGQSGRRLVILVDGVRHESQKWGLDHAPELDPFVYGALRVVKGASGVAAGPDALSGVIEVDPVPFPTARGISTEAWMVGVDNGVDGTLALRVDGVGDGVRWRLQGDASSGAARRAPDYVLGNTGSASADVAGRLELGGPDLGLALAWTRHAQRTGVCFCVVSATPEDLAERLSLGRPPGSGAWRAARAIERPWQDVVHDLVLARGHAGGRRFLGTVTFDTQLDHREEYATAREAITGPQFDFRLATHTLSGTLGHLPVAVGGADLEGEAGVTGALQTNVYSGLPLLPNHRSWTGGAFARERFDAGPVLLEAGARLDAQELVSFLSEDRYAASDPPGCALGETSARCPRTFVAGSGSVGGRVTLAEGVDVALDLALANRFPDPDELLLSGFAPSLPVWAVGDATLPVERGRSAGAELRVERRAVHLHVAPYVEHVEDYVAFGPVLGPGGEPRVDVTIRGAFPRFAYRRTTARFAGVDGGVAFAPEGPVSLLVQGAILRADDLDRGEPLPFQPSDRASATLTVRPTAASELHASVEGVARQRIGGDIAPPAEPYALLGLGGSLDLRAARGRADVKLGLEASNLLDQRYRDGTSLLRYFADDPGRELRLRLGVITHPKPRSA